MATSTLILPGLLGRTRRQRPDLLLTVNAVQRISEVVELLELEKADVAIAVDYPGLELRHSRAVAHRDIATEPAFVALPAGHRLGRRTEIALADLAEETWLLAPDDGAGWPEVFHRACAAAGFAAVAVREFCGGRLELQDMIAAGLGISIVRASTRPLGEVVVRPLTGMPIRVRHLLVWRTAAVGGEIAEALFGAATAAHRDLVAGVPQVQPWIGGVHGEARP